MDADSFKPRESDREDLQSSSYDDDPDPFPQVRALNFRNSLPAYPSVSLARPICTLLPISATFCIAPLRRFVLWLGSLPHFLIIFALSLLPHNYFFTMPFGINLFGGVSFDPTRDIPDLSGKVILVTGGNIGLGKQSILMLAQKNPSVIYLAARSEEKFRAAILELSSQVPDASIIHFLPLDLASFASVRAAVKTFLAAESRLDILLLNAGIMAPPPGLTADGYELQFGTNHMGHALLTKLLLPALTRTAASPDADVRVVTLSSAGHALAISGLDFSSFKTMAESMGAYPCYGQSKLANILFARQLAVEYPAIKSVSVHPGIVRTNLMAGTTGTPWWMQKVSGMANNFFTPVEKGVCNQLWAATAKAGDVVNGEYYTPVGVLGGGTAYAGDLETAKKLWDWTEKELEGWLAENKEE